MKVIDLYCGAGGLSLGFKDVGFDVVYAVDNDPIAVDHYNKNVDNVALREDVLKLNLDDLPDVDGIIGGPPCQAFSIAGKRLATDPRTSLSMKFVDVVAKKKPRFFVMENVDGLLSMDMMDILLKLFKEADYHVEVKLLNAVDYGIPQFRKRPFFVGFYNGEGAFGLLPTPLPRHHRKTVRQTLKNYEHEWYYRHPRTYGRRAVYPVDEPSPTIRTVNRPMPPNYRRHPNDAPYIEGKVRALTAEERALIQTFPSDFTWFGTKSEKEKLIGNAVPPKLAKVVARAVKTFSS